MAMAGRAIIASSSKTSASVPASSVDATSETSAEAGIGRIACIPSRASTAELPNPNSAMHANPSDSSIPSDWLRRRSSS